MCKSVTCLVGELVVLADRADRPNGLVAYLCRDGRKEVVVETSRGTVETNDTSCTIDVTRVWL